MALGDLTEAIDALELGDDRDELAGALGLLDRLHAKVALAVGDLDASGAYEDDGDLTAKTWLQHHTRRDPVSAARLVRCGRRLRRWPELAHAATTGALSWGQVEVAIAVVGRHVERFAEHEAKLVPLLAPLTVEQTAAVLHDWRARAEAADDGPEPGDRPGRVHLAPTLDGGGDLRGSLGPDLYATVAAALRLADAGDLEVPATQRRADALGTVCRHFLDHQRDQRGGRRRPHLNVVCTYDDLVRDLGSIDLETGARLSGADTAVLACDAIVHRILVDSAGAVLDYGRATRTWPVDLYNAIAARDQGCRWPGCDRPATWCDVHHVVPWEAHGPTSIDNGALLCRRHHRKLHHGWSAKLLPDGTFELTAPDGRTESSEPRGPTRRRRCR